MKDIPRYYTDQEILHAALILLIIAVWTFAVWKNLPVKGYNYLKSWYQKRREDRIGKCEHYFPIAECLTAPEADLPYLKCLKCNSPLGEVTGGKIA